MHYINGDIEIGDYLNGDPKGTHFLYHKNGEVELYKY